MKPADWSVQLESMVNGERIELKKLWTTHLAYQERWQRLNLTVGQSSSQVCRCVVDVYDLWHRSDSASRFTLRLRVLFCIIRHALMKLRLFVLHTHFNTCPHFPEMSSLCQYNVYFGPHNIACTNTQQIESRFRVSSEFPLCIYQFKHPPHVQTCNCDHWNVVVVKCGEGKHHCHVFCPLLTFLGHSGYAAAAGWMHVLP